MANWLCLATFWCVCVCVLRCCSVGWMSWMVLLGCLLFCCSSLAWHICILLCLYSLLVKVALLASFIFPTWLRLHIQCILIFLHKPHQTIKSSTSLEVFFQALQRLYHLIRLTANGWFTKGKRGYIYSKIHKEGTIWNCKILFVDRTWGSLESHQLLI